jgi:hypothetical protein
MHNMLGSDHMPIQKTEQQTKQYLAKCHVACQNPYTRFELAGVYGPGG